jgi:outer membrane protein insertion porin family
MFYQISTCILRMIKPNLRIHLFLLAILIVLTSTSGIIQAQSLDTDPVILKYRGIVSKVRIEGLQLIEKGLIYSTISSQQGLPLSPATVSGDIKSLFELGYFKEVDTEIEMLEDNQIELIFNLVEKPRIAVIEIEGNVLVSDKDLKEKMKVYPNNMVNPAKIKMDVNAILEEYRRKGYMQTQVSSQINTIDNSTVSLTFKVVESPKVFLTLINITGTEVYPPLDIERRLVSAEVDCFAWANSSGIFQESMVNQDMQVITQHYLQNGYIKLKIDKPKVVLIRNRDYSKVTVDINITEGAQYFTGKTNIVAQDGKELLFDKEEKLQELELKPTDVYNPYKQTEDRFKISSVYLEQGYAFSKVRVSNKFDDENKTVDITYHVTRGEKAYIGRVEIQGNYETMDRVVRRELEIHDNELYNGVKLRESQRKINRLGFFRAGTGVRFQQNDREDSNTLDYDVLLEEGETGTFNASITYSGDSGAALVLSVTKKNFFGTGRTLSFSTELKDQGDSRYDFAITTPYWFDTNFTNTFKVYSVFENDTYYDTRTSGFSFGLSYPVWKNWTTSSTYAWKDEDYEDIDDTGETLLNNKIRNTFRSLGLGLKYSTVNHPIFPSSGNEASLYTEQIGGQILSGTTEYRTRGFTYRYFNTLNEAGTLVLGVKFNWAFLEKSNPNMEIPYGKRYTVGGITTVRGFDWNDIKGPSSESELPDGFDITEKYPYRTDYILKHGLPDQASCDADPVCASLPLNKDPDRAYYETHMGGIEKRVLNVQMYFPLTREGTNIKGLVFYDAGNVWAEDKMYELTDVKRDDWYYRQSIGTGINLVTPMGVLRFEYGYKLDRKEGESAGRFDFHISGLF